MFNSQSNAIYVGKQCLSRNLSSPHDYIQASHLYQMLSEATKIMLRKNAVTSNQVITEFLQQCNKGEHVLLKSYGSFSKSVLCKLCFLYNFMKIFQIQSVQRNALDYYQLSRLLCSDFPKQFIQKAAALLLPNQDSTSQMYKLLPSKQIQQAIYLYMIYTEYLDTFLGYFQQQEELDFLQVYRIMKTEDCKNWKQLTKPPFAIMAQCLLTLMKQKGMFAELQSPVIFVTEENIEDFIRQASTNHPEPKLKSEQMLRKLLESQQYENLVEQNLQMFQNSQSWASECHKILSARQPLETPLNVKKKGTKK